MLATDNAVIPYAVGVGHRVPHEADRL
ncbi:MAG: hypothetical protein M3463_17215 [Verrucomicrobiota bacterium]|nr:hypothetical protein [Verrucomicrobiota bacterium]